MNTTQIDFTLPFPPAFVWGTLLVIGIGIASWIVFFISDRAAKDTPPLESLRDHLGLSGLNGGAFLVGAVLWLAVFVTLFVGLVWLLWTLIVFEVPQGPAAESAFRFRLAQIAGLVAVLGAVIGLPITLNRLRLQREANKTDLEGQITDRISKAVLALGETRDVTQSIRDVSFLPEPEANKEISVLERQGEPPELPEKANKIKRSGWQSIVQNQPNLEVRIGAIFALERISRDSFKDHMQVMEILCSYVRQNARASLPLSDTEIEEPPTVREDIQIILTVLGRRSGAGRTIEKKNRFRLDLSGTDLAGASFAGAHFVGANLSNSNLAGCVFEDANLEGAVLSNSVLSHAWFQNTDLTGANLNHCRLRYPTPPPGQMNFSLNLAKSLRGVSLAGADIRAVDYIGEPDVVSQTFGNSDTKLHWDYEDAYKQATDREARRDIALAKRKGDFNEATKLQNKIDETGFQNWSPYGNRDLANGHLYTKLAKSLGLTGFPYFDK